MDRSYNASVPAGYCHLAHGLLLLAFLLAACSSGQSQLSQTPTETAVVTLLPYRTSTSTVTPAPSLLDPTRTPLPSPTPTPYTHTIKKDETLLGIAFRYGVKLEDLLAANPGINIHFLTIGTVLVIPLTSGLETPTPTVAPPPLLVSEPVCYVGQDSYLQCLAEVNNPMQEAYEKLTFVFRLHAEDGSLISEQFVVPPLDRLLPGQTLPVLASFSLQQSGIKIENYSVRITLLSALPILYIENQANSSNRYMEYLLNNLQVKTNDEYGSASVTGTIGVVDGTGTLWLVAVAYGEDQKPVGLRRLEFNDICPLQTNETPAATGNESPSLCMELPFELFVYSLGPAIDRVEVFAEAYR